MEKIMFSISLEGAGVGDTALGKAQGLKMLTSAWQAVLGPPVTGRLPPAALPSAVTVTASQHCLKHLTALDTFF